jgi:GT2 family glycosyltransferase
MSQAPAIQPKISVIILNFNGQEWLGRCFESLEAQTIFAEIEVILTDNNSADGSDRFAAAWLERTGKGRVVQNGANLYYCQANNNGADAATGKYLLFLNNDTWLERDCLEKLYQEVEITTADAATPIVLNYDDDSFQNMGGCGLDIFGLVPAQSRVNRTTEIFAACGCSFFISVTMFKKIGGFDGELLIYADETDLSWKVWIAGGKVVAVPAARLHHRGAAVVNPEGKTKTVESRTSETKRFLANRNGILFLLKNSQHILLLLLIPHLALLLLEAATSLVLVRRWSYVRISYLSAIVDAFRLRRHVREWRRRIRTFRQRGDFWMLRFFRLRFARWDEVTRLFKFGPPKVDAK